MEKNAIVFLADGFEEIEALAPADVMRRAGVKVKLVTINKTTTVTSSHNVVVIADQTINQPLGPYDIIVLPGGMPGTSNLNSCPFVKEQILKAYDDGKVLAAICAAPMILGQLGLLKGHKATCFPGFEQYLDGASLTSRGVVVDGNVITAIGAGVSLDFGVHLVAALLGQDVANDIAQKMQMNK